MAKRTAKSTKKKTAARTGTTNRGGRSQGTLAGQLLATLVDDAGHRGHAASAVASDAVGDAAGVKPVVFNCSNPACLVGITAGTLNITFAGTGGATMPVGSFPIFWRVQGGGTFKLIVQAGGTLSSPIDSTAPDAGTRTLTVSP